MCYPISLNKIDPFLFRLFLINLWIFAINIIIIIISWLISLLDEASHLECNGVDLPESYAWQVNW